MSEENILPEGEEETILPEGEEEGNLLEGEDEPNEVELEAMSKGWSREGIEGKRNLSAEEFIDRQPLYERMHKTDRAMKRMEEQNQAVTQHLEMMRKSLSEDKVDSLKAKKREALEESDHDEVMRIDEEIIKASEVEEIVVPEVVDTSAYDTWLEQNQWYDNNDEMKAYADRLGAGILAQDPAMSLKDVYSEVTDEVKVRFSDQFITKPRVDSVEGGRPRGRAKAAKHTVKDLDSETRSVMNNLVGMGVMTEAEYLADLETTGYFN